MRLQSTRRKSRALFAASFVFWLQLSLFSVACVDASLPKLRIELRANKQRTRSTFQLQHQTTQQAEFAQCSSRQIKSRDSPSVASSLVFLVRATFLLELLHRCNRLESDFFSLLACSFQLLAANYTHTRQQRKAACKHSFGDRKFALASGKQRSESLQPRLTLLASSASESKSACRKGI